MSRTVRSHPMKTPSGGVTVRRQHTDRRDAKAGVPEYDHQWVKGEDPFDGSPRYSIAGRDPSASYERITAVIVQEKEPEFRGGSLVKRYYAEVYDTKAESGTKLGPFKAVKEAKAAVLRVIPEYLQREAADNAKAKGAAENSPPPVAPDLPPDMGSLSEQPSHVTLTRGAFEMELIPGRRVGDGGELVPDDGSFVARSSGAMGRSQDMPISVWAQAVAELAAKGYELSPVTKSRTVSAHPMQTASGKVVPRKQHSDRRPAAKPKAAKAPKAPAAVEQVVALPLKQVRPDPNQHRKVFDKASLQELMDSIAASGQKTPVVVRPVEGGYQIIAGERRYRACTALGLKTIRAVIRENVSDEDALIEQVIENLNRQNVLPTEEGTAYRQLADGEMRLIKRRKQYAGTDWSTPEAQDKLEAMGRAYAAKKSGKQRARVNDYIVLCDLPEEAREMVDRGSISIAHAHALLRLIDPHEDGRLYTDAALRKERNQHLVRMARHARANSGITARVLSGMVVEYIRAQQQTTMFEDVDRDERALRRQAQKAAIQRVLESILAAITAAFSEKEQTFKVNYLSAGDLQGTLGQLDGAIKSLQEMRATVEREMMAREVVEATKRRVTQPAAETGGSVSGSGAKAPAASGVMSLFKALVQHKASTRKTKTGGVAPVKAHAQRHTDAKKPSFTMPKRPLKPDQRAKREASLGLPSDKAKWTRQQFAEWMMATAVDNPDNRACIANALDPKKPKPANEWCLTWDKFQQINADEKGRQSESSKRAKAAAKGRHLWEKSGQVYYGPEPEGVSGTGIAPAIAMFEVGGKRVFLVAPESVLQAGYRNVVAGLKSGERIVPPSGMIVTEDEDKAEKTWQAAALAHKRQHAKDDDATGVLTPDLLEGLYGITKSVGPYTRTTPKSHRKIRVRGYARDEASHSPEWENAYIGFATPIVDRYPSKGERMNQQGFAHATADWPMKQQRLLWSGPGKSVEMLARDFTRNDRTWRVAYDAAGQPVAAVVWRQQPGKGGTAELVGYWTGPSVDGYEFAGKTAAASPDGPLAALLWSLTYENAQVVSHRKQSPEVEALWQALGQQPDTVLDRVMPPDRYVRHRLRRVQGTRLFDVEQETPEEKPQEQMSLFE